MEPRMLEWTQEWKLVWTLKTLLWVGMAGPVWAYGQSPQIREDRLLECESNFTPDASAESLAERFGPANVTRTEVYVGEGFYETGTVLFPESPEDRVEILWADAGAQRGPSRVRVRGPDSSWRTSTGIGTGTDLKAVEALNGGPFRLLGFAWDYAGTVISWEGGSLEAGPEAACALRVRMSPAPIDEDQQRWYGQVLGDREFSSAHDAMQSLNPRVYELWIDYGRR